jgi:hypothetical protein
MTCPKCGNPAESGKMLTCTSWFCRQCGKIRLDPPPGEEPLEGMSEWRDIENYAAVAPVFGRPRTRAKR